MPKDKECMFLLIDVQWIKIWMIYMNKLFGKSLQDVNNYTFAVSEAEIFWLEGSEKSNL